MISAFLPDFTEFLPSTGPPLPDLPGPPLPDLQGFHSQMAKVEAKEARQNNLAISPIHVL